MAVPLFTPVLGAGRFQLSRGSRLRMRRRWRRPKCAKQTSTRSSVVSKLKDSLNSREANAETALNARDRHQTMSIPHPSAFVSKRPFLRQLISPLHPAIDSL
jgi:hypothetical protein